MQTLVSIITELDVVRLESDNCVICFGRGPDVDVTIGHRPQLDTIVPRRSGEIWAHRGWVMVSNLGEALAIGAHIVDQPITWIRPNTVFGFEAGQCDLTIEGLFRHTLRITNDDTHQSTTLLQGAPPQGLKTTDVLPQLSERQRVLLDCYVEPLRHGSAEPRTHQEVATIMGISRSLVRVEANAIWDRFDRAVVPMRQHRDKIEDVIDAWTRHRL